MKSPVSECDTKNTDLSKLGPYRISDTAQNDIRGGGFTFRVYGNIKCRALLNKIYLKSL
jgi:hypothetical protein